MTFDEAFAALIGNEGGFTDDPRDDGNWTGGKQGVGVLRGTKFGLAANTYPNVDIKALTIEGAKAIYRRDWWDALRIEDLPDLLRFDIFDAAVNHGAGTAARLLQRAAGVAEDGAIGPVTLAAARRVEPAVLLCRFNGCRLDFYTRLSKWPTFGAGWARRISANLRRVGHA